MKKSIIIIIFLLSNLVMFAQESDIEKCIRQKIEYEAKIKTLDANIQKYKTDSIALDKTIKDLTAKNADLESQVTVFKDDTNKKSVKQLELDKAALQKENDDLKKKNDALETEKIQLNKDLTTCNESNKKTAELEKKNIALETEKVTSVTTITNLNNSITANTVTINSLNSQITTKEATINTLNSQIITKESTINSLNSQITANTATINSLNSQIADFNTENTKQNQIILANIKLAYDNLINSTLYDTKKITDLQASIDVSAKYVNNSTEITTMTNQLAKYTTLSIAINEAISVLSIAYDKEKITAAQTKLKSATGITDIQKKEITNYQELLNDYCSKNNYCSTQLEKATNAVDNNWEKIGVPSLNDAIEIIGRDYYFLQEQLNIKLKDRNYKSAIKKSLDCN